MNISHHNFLIKSYNSQCFLLGDLTAANDDS